jgi:hypothetical protein
LLLSTIQTSHNLLQLFFFKKHVNYLLGVIDVIWFR